MGPFRDMKDPFGGVRVSSRNGWGSSFESCPSLRKSCVRAWPGAALSAGHCPLDVGTEVNIINKKHDILGIFIPYFTRKIWNKNTQYVVIFIYNIGFRCRLFIRIMLSFTVPVLLCLY